MHCAFANHNLIVISFVCLAKKYKLQVKVNCVHFHRFAEYFSENEEKLRNTYWKEIGLKTVMIVNQNLMILKVSNHIFNS